MKHRLLALILLLGTAMGFGSCETIQTAPKGSPRIEVAVIYRVDEAFFSPFTEAIDKQGVQALLQEAVNPLANIGLRFYAVPADQYGKGQKWPDYIMTVRALSCTPNRQVKTTKVKVKVKDSHSDDKKKDDKKDGVGDPLERESKEEKQEKKFEEITKIRATLNGVSCELEVQLSKMRVDAPQLIVGATKSVASASTSREDKSNKLPLTKKADEENDISLTEGMLRRAFSAAAKRAFVKLQKPIDRELQSLVPQKKGKTR